MLEAMKMEHNVVAPFAGTVREVRSEAGEQLGQGAIVIVMEPDDPEPA